jgi:hypothetical protein
MIPAVMLTMILSYGNAQMVFTEPVEDEETCKQSLYFIVSAHPMSPFKKWAIEDISCTLVEIPVEQADWLDEGEEFNL